MLDGVVPFPPEFAVRYRALGYWRGESLQAEFADVFGRFADRVALIDRERAYSYREIDTISDRLALNLLALGLRPLDRAVVQLPNVAEFVFLYFALQKIGAIPIAALASHRFAEVSQFVSIAGAAACFYPGAHGDFRFAPMIDRVQAEWPSLRLRVVGGVSGPAEH